MIFRQVQPRREQLFRFAFLHGRKIQITKKLTPMEISGKQRIRHLPEKILV